MSTAFVADLDSPSASGDRRLPLIVAGTCVLLMAAIGARAQLVRLVPRTAVLFELAGLPVNLSGLALDRVNARIVADGDRRVLVVEGDIVNSGDRDEPARPLAVAVRGDGNEAIYTWTIRAPQQKVAARERAAFVARLASPPGGGTQVSVEFDRADTKPSVGASKKPETRSRFQGSSTESQ